MIKLIKGECLTEMHNMADESVNLVICDLPYGTTANEWDVVIDNDILFEEYKRILTKNGTAILFGSEPFSTTLRVAGMDIYRYDWIWLKTTSGGFIHAKNKPLKKHENISVFSKGVAQHETVSDNRYTYNPQGLVKLKDKIVTEVKTDVTDGGKQNYSNNNITAKIYNTNDGKFETEYTNYPTSLLEFSLNNKRLHPTEKPAPLYEYLIKTYSNPGDVILDNCAGSGTLGAAGLNIPDREYIMIELEPKYQETIINRVPGLEVIEGSNEVYVRHDFKNFKYVEDYLKKHGLPETLEAYPGNRRDLEKFLKKNGTTINRVLR